MKLKDAVMKKCQSSGRSMRSLAIEAGIEPGLFNAYVQGKRPNRKNAERVAAVLGITPRKLFQDFDQLRSY